MKKSYNTAVKYELSRTKNLDPPILTESDMVHVPEPVKKYIRYAGFLGKEKVTNFRCEFAGGIRFQPHESYMPLKSVQYDFTDNFSRFFYIVAKRKGIPAMGLHLYRNAIASFKIKILGLFTVVDAYGPEMDRGETVTILNDMFFIAPGALIDQRIVWETLDNLSVKAVFTNGDITVSAMAWFDAEGKLLNFKSGDRYETIGKEFHNYPWKTPVVEYGNINGYRLPAKAELIYERPLGDFCYGVFELTEVEFNCRELK